MIAGHDFWDLEDHSSSKWEKRLINSKQENTNFEPSCEKVESQLLSMQVNRSKRRASFFHMLNTLLFFAYSLKAYVALFSSVFMFYKVVVERTSMDSYGP